MDLEDDDVIGRLLDVIDVRRAAPAAGDVDLDDDVTGPRLLDVMLADAARLLG